jgi:hypothetical protein
VAADPEASQANWEGTQLHHIEAKAADPVPNPERAVDPNNLLFTRGRARTQGTSHNAVTEGPTDTHPHVNEKSRMQWEEGRRTNPNSDLSGNPGTKGEQPRSVPSEPTPAIEEPPIASTPKSPTPEPPSPQPPSEGVQRPGNGSGGRGGGVGGVLFSVLGVIGLVFQYWDFHDAREEGRRQEQLRKAEPGLYIYTDPKTGQQKQYIVR